MNTKKIFIDATRDNNYSIVILNKEGDLEECNFENQGKQTFKSNIYLAKIIRVEHSLQAAFVEYAEDKVGFLPFSEINPDYYQIPVFDKEKIQQSLKEEAEKNMAMGENYVETLSENGDNSENEDFRKNEEDSEDSNSDHQYKIYKKYSIQEVIKKNQVVLVQIFRDERGNKGASLTTYISLPGRYCVFMPNSPKGIGISKKAQYEEKKRLINIVKKFNIVTGTSLIVRTAAVNASEKDLQRDYIYLTSLWNEIRKKAVGVKLCSLVYQECNIVEQTLRDHYDPNEVESIVVSGKNGYDKILNFIKKLIPGEERKLKFHNDRFSLYTKYEIDAKINQLLSERVDLKSGGYLVINPTEALISIDVNSGKATNEKNIETMATKINLEAAHEIGRQVKLRNLGGLIVIDFIDMYELKNKKALEQELRKIFANDKAKVQFTRISIFGIVEMSRQRLRSGLAEILTMPCGNCHGVGRVKSLTLVATNILDTILEHLNDKKFVKKNIFEILCSKNLGESLVALNIDEINNIENEFNIKIAITNHNFAHEDEFILRTVDKIDNLETATQLYSSVAAKMQVASTKQKKNGLIAKILKKFYW